ncbi:MAG: metallophosphoesterase [Deltaproteobacteria bacterium]|nr:metallophosphoesterase [Deltaproteobacteria bacterium]
MKFLHISDLHFHRDGENNQDANRLLKNIKERYPDHAVIITGDITDDGHRQQYQNALDALGAFAGRVFIAPGNHDFGAAGHLYSRKKADLFDDMLAAPLGQRGFFSGNNTPVINDIDGVRLIALDTNLETNHPFDFACGEIGFNQLFALDKILDRADDRVKILFFHHHPFIYNNPFMELRDAGKLARVLYNRVDVILFGHKHEMMDWENRWNIKYILASDNSPGKSKAGEITVENGRIGMKYVEI